MKFEKKKKLLVLEQVFVYRGVSTLVKLIEKGVSSKILEEAYFWSEIGKKVIKVMEDDIESLKKTQTDLRKMGITVDVYKDVILDLKEKVKRLRRALKKEGWLRSINQVIE